MLRNIPLAMVGLIVGGIITTIGIIAYPLNYAALNLGGLFYGVPILLGGLALKAAELKPIPYSEEPTPEIIALREEQATPTQDQVRQDVTRFRYGQEAHLDDSLKRVGLSPADDQRPDLVSIYETSVDGAYALVLQFYSPLVDFETWQKQQDKVTTFFGPDIKAEVSQPEEDRVDLALIKC
ncbi:DUF2854 domain-containing protein [Hyella patelloides]|nr:DUF2854 domain-containing protein [Hyella patelloides]